MAFPQLKVELQFTTKFSYFETETKNYKVECLKLRSSCFEYLAHQKFKAAIVMIQAVISTFLREIFFDCRINVVAIEIKDLASTFIAF